MYKCGNCNEKILKDYAVMPCCKTSVCGSCLDHVSDKNCPKCHIVVTVASKEVVEQQSVMLNRDEIIKNLINLSTFLYMTVNFLVSYYWIYLMWYNYPSLDDGAKKQLGGYAVFIVFNWIVAWVSPTAQVVWFLTILNNLKLNRNRLKVLGLITLSVITNLVGFYFFYGSTKPSTIWIRLLTAYIISAISGVNIAFYIFVFGCLFWFVVLGIPAIIVTCIVFLIKGSAGRLEQLLYPITKPILDTGKYLVITYGMHLITILVGLIVLGIMYLVYRFCLSLCFRHKTVKRRHYSVSV